MRQLPNYGRYPYSRLQINKNNIYRKTLCRWLSVKASRDSLITKQMLRLAPLGSVHGSLQLPTTLVYLHAYTLTHAHEHFWILTKSLGHTAGANTYASNEFETKKRKRQSLYVIEYLYKQFWEYMCMYVFKKRLRVEAQNK